uniref:Prolactin-induced protein n=1 Tax=Catagonus wagneri TaxID=51154 RepID=A0A8C3YD88_9CETA
MHSLYLLLRVSPAALLLILCLQLGTNKAQEVEDTRKVLTLNLQLPQNARANEEVTVTLNVATQLRECMVIKAYLESNIPVEGSFNYKYTSCLCDSYPRNFFWDFQTNSSIVIKATVDVIRELGICPQDLAVIPIQANRFYSIRNLTVV